MTCPQCHTPVNPYASLPLLGWIVPGAHGCECKARLSNRYRLIEATSAALALAVVLTKHSAHDIVFGLVLVAVLVPVAVIDFDYRLIPNKITLPAAALAVILGLALRPSAVGQQLIAGAAAGGFLLLFALAYPAGMGMGDVKLAAVLGLFLGRGVVLAMLCAVIVSALVGLAVIARVGLARGRKTALPFGPFLALGGLIALFAV